MCARSRAVRACARAERVGELASCRSIHCSRVSGFSMVEDFGIAHCTYWGCTSYPRTESKSQPNCWFICTVVS